MIIAHILVGPGEGRNALEVVLERAKAWADEIFCVLDPGVGTKEKILVDEYADAHCVGSALFLLDEASYRQTAWNLMVASLGPSPEDWIVCLDADEIIHTPQLVRKAAKTFTGKRLGFTIYHLWDNQRYRLDQRFKPSVEWLMFPFQSGAHWAKPARVPEYVYGLQPVSDPLTDILHLGYRTPALRTEKLRRDMARKRMSPTEMLTTPSLQQWKKGGLPK